MANNSLNVYGAPEQGISAQHVGTAMAVSRQAQEVQAAMVVAKNFPRDPQQSLDRILASCMRPTLAEASTYEFSRSGSKISGPSIRLAECIAQAWGNLDFGFTELERKNGESTVMAYAWDLETNTRQSRVFNVKHKRDTSKGAVALTDERDIYEMIANQAARRVRNCILSLIPGDVIDAAIQQCDLTMKAQAKDVKIEQRRKDMVEAFQVYGVTPEMLAAFCQKRSIDYIDEADIKKLRKAYTGFKDGLVGIEYFTGRMEELAAKQKKAQEEPAAEPQTGAAEPEDPGLDDL